jgi:hypothetical protein
LNNTCCFRLVLERWADADGSNELANRLWAVTAGIGERSLG